MLNSAQGERATLLNDAQGERATVQDLSDVGRLVYLLFQRTAEDADKLAQELFREGRRTAEEALLREAQRVGCGVVQVVLPPGELMSWVRQRADWAADKVCATYNQDLINEIARIIAETPTANRWVVASRLQQWEFKRGSWKSPQIATTEAFTIENEAKMRFNAMNSVKEPEYWFGYSLICEVCQNIARRNPHTRRDAERIGLPHVGCLDHWHVRKGEYVDCSDLWLG